MTKYNYNKSVLSDYSTKPFMNEVEERNRHIEAATDALPPSDYAVNATARKLHPHFQHVKIAKVTPYMCGVQYTLVADKEKGTSELAFFRPGQFISVAFMMNGKPTTRTYHLCGSPKDALGPDGTYTLMVTAIPGRTACFYIHENWKVGTELMISGPLGHLYHQSLRDGKRIFGIGTAGYFYSYGRAIIDGLLDIDMTVVNPTFVLDEFTMNIEKEIMEKTGGRVKFIPVLIPMPGAPVPTELPEGVKMGPITSDMILEVLGGDVSNVSVFSDCIPLLEQMSRAALLGAGIPESHIHREWDGALDSPADDPAYPLDPASDEAFFTATVHARNACYTVPCGGTETLLVSLQKAGIAVPSQCRTGFCGWCNSRLLSGEVFVPEQKDGRREADKKFGWIHPCCTYPLSDVELEVFPLFGPK